MLQKHLDSAAKVPRHKGHVPFFVLAPTTSVFPDSGGDGPNVNVGESFGEFFMML